MDYPKVIVAGDRRYTDVSHIKEVMNAYWKLYGPYEVISGTAKGVDTTAENIATAAGIKVYRFPADWDKHGKAAGPIRNKQMAEAGDALIAFLAPDSRGTANMIATAKRLELDPIVVIQIGAQDG